MVEYRTESSASRGFDFPFIIVPTALFTRYVDVVGHLAVHVYCALATFADDKRTCFPGLDAIAKRAGVSRSTVQRSLQALEGAGLLRIEARTRDGGGAASNHYTLLDGRAVVPTEQAACADGPSRSACADGPSRLFPQRNPLVPTAQLTRTIQLEPVNKKEGTKTRRAAAPRATPSRTRSTSIQESEPATAEAPHELRWQPVVDLFAAVFGRAATYKTRGGTNANVGKFLRAVGEASGDDPGRGAALVQTFFDVLRARGELEKLGSPWVHERFATWAATSSAARIPKEPPPPPAPTNDADAIERERARREAIEQAKADREAQNALAEYERAQRVAAAIEQREREAEEKRRIREFNLAHAAERRARQLSGLRP